MLLAYHEVSQKVNMTGPHIILQSNVIIIKLLQKNQS